tara:strand:+ start:449 stop:1030 length:582 start_codon:yes stop_codon:yes gene_type:complete
MIISPKLKIKKKSRIVNSSTDSSCYSDFVMSTAEAARLESEADAVEAAAARRAELEAAYSKAMEAVRTAELDAKRARYVSAKAFDKAKAAELEAAIAAAEAQAAEAQTALAAEDWALWAAAMAVLEEAKTAEAAFREKEDSCIGVGAPASVFKELALEQRKVYARLRAAGAAAVTARKKVDRWEKPVGNCAVQ